MKEDIQRIKRANLDHIGEKISKTNNTLVTLESLLGKKFEELQTLSSKTSRCLKSSKVLERHTQLLGQITQLKNGLAAAGISEQWSKTRRDIELMVRQIIKYFTTQIAAKDSIILKLQKDIEQWSSKSKWLEQELTTRGRIQHRFNETMPNTKPIPSNYQHSQPKYSSLATTRRPDIPQELIATEIFKHSENQDFIHVKSEILQKNRLHKRSANLVDISEEFKARENQYMKSVSNREMKQDSAPSLPKPLRKNFHEKLSFDLYEQVLAQKIEDPTRPKNKPRRSSVHEIETAYPSSRNKPTGPQLFKGKRALLMASDTRGPDLSKFLSKNR